MNKAWMQTRAFRAALLALAVLMSAGAAAGIGSMGLAQWRAAGARAKISEVNRELEKMRADAIRKEKAEAAEENGAGKHDEAHAAAGTVTATPTPIPSPTPDKLLDLVKEKRLFGVEKREVVVNGIMGDAVLIGDKWYKAGDTTEAGQLVIEVLANLAIVEQHGERFEARPFAPMPGTEGVDASKFRNVPRDGEGGRSKGGRGRMGDRGRGYNRDGGSSRDRSAGVVATPSPAKSEEQRRKREEAVKREIERRRENTASGAGMGAGGQGRNARGGDGARVKERNRDGSGGGRGERNRDR